MLMIDQLTKTIGKTFIAKALAKNAVKILVDNSDNYRRLVTELRNRGRTFYTYQLKSDKPFRVVIRGLHSTINSAEMKAAIKKLG